MPDDDEWAFENEIDLWDDGASPPPAEDEPEPEPDGLAGRDGDSVVTVTVSPEGEIRQVRLAEDWKSKLDPRGLHSSVLTAVNAATIEALARRAQAVTETPLPLPPADADETPLTAQDVLRLEEAVRGELEQFSTRMSAAGTGVVTAESSGGHVNGSAQSGRYLGLDLDATWASIARNAEVESELLDVLRTLHRRSAPSDFAPQPQGPAYAELMGLLADPARLLRRVGLTPPTGHLEGRDRR